VQIASIPPNELLESLERGVLTDDGEFLQALRGRLLRSGAKNCWLEITLDEGKNRQIRRMLATLQIDVLRLVRVSIGPLQLGTLAKGGHRQLTAEEKAALDRAVRSGPRADVLLP
jgi:23S rRNA pseudouridine2605 synthase